MNDHGKSDGPVVPAKPLNKPAVVAGAEAVAGRGPAKGNTASETRLGRIATDGNQSRDVDPIDDRLYVPSGVDGGHRFGDISIVARAGRGASKHAAAASTPTGPA